MVLTISYKKIMNRKEQLTEIVSPLSSDNDVVLKYVQQLEDMFSFIVPERIGDGFCKALENDDYSAAVKECALYYRKKAYPQVPEILATGDYDLNYAEKSLKGFAWAVNIDWTFENGEIDFLFNPTKLHGPLNHEWLWQFNRHVHWENMAKAYADIGDERFAAEFEKQLLKWIAQTDIPQNWNGPDSAWRTIECGLRLMGSWQVAFEGFRRSQSVSDVALLLMIASMHKQAMHLVEHPTGMNWLMMESDGVYTFSSLFCELSDSADNRRIAIGRLVSRLEEQILPDGMHNELSPDYQSVVYRCVMDLYGLSLGFGTTDEIPNRFVELIKSTVKAAVLLSTPAFTQPRTNDTYTIRTDYFTLRAERLFGTDPLYSFVNTKRKEGCPPITETASAYLPYAGFAVMRSDWSEDATYLCFDVGPLGMAHQHQDMLNINIYKGGQELIYDDGGGQYDHSAARGYAVSGHAHNTVLVDSKAQNRKAPLCYKEPYDAKWESNDVFDYAAGIYDDTFGGEMLKLASHKREIRFCKPDFFCVCDTLSSADGEAHDFEILFQLDTTKVQKLPEFPNAIVSCFDKEYEIAVIPLDEESEQEIVSASGDPLAFGWEKGNKLRGWYNGRNEVKLHASITVSRKVTGKKQHRFNTLLVPLKKGADSVEVIKNSDADYDVVINGKKHHLNLKELDK